MSRREDRLSSGSGSSRRNDGGRRYDGHRHQEIDPEYDARTYTSLDSRHMAPVPQSGLPSSKQQRPSLVNYDYASDDSPKLLNSGSKKKEKDKRRSPSLSPVLSKKERKEAKKSKKKKKARSISRERENSNNKRPKLKRVTSPPMHAQPHMEDDIRIVSPTKRRLSPPRQYAYGSPQREPPASPPRAYQAVSGKGRDYGSRLQRSRDRSPLHRHPKSPTSPFG